jgi:hypothetical protein
MCGRWIDTPMKNIFRPAFERIADSGHDRHIDPMRSPRCNT